MKAILNQFNRFELPLLVIICAFAILQKSELFDIGVLLIPVCSLVALLYIIQGRFGQFLLSKQPLPVRLYPSFFGNFSGISLIGILFKVMEYPGASLLAKVGVFGMLLCSLALFYPTIQNEFIPVMRKFLFRIAVLISMNLWLSI